METVLTLLKQALGFTSDVRDLYLRSLIQATMIELGQVHGYTPDLDDISQLMFVVDVAEWRYNGRNTNAPMPEHLKVRMRDYLIHYRRSDRPETPVPPPGIPDGGYERFRLSFQPGSWAQSLGWHTLTIPRDQHGLGYQATVEEIVTAEAGAVAAIGGYGVRRLTNGGITIRVKTPFTGAITLQA